MNGKNRMLFRVIAGGYLAYLGIDLLKNTMSGQTDNPVMFGGFGGAFLILGVGYILYSLKRYKEREASEVEEMEEKECPEEKKKESDDEKEHKEE